MSASAPAAMPAPEPVFEDIADAIARHATQRPSDPAIWYDGEGERRWWSWRDFDQGLNRVANALVGLGVGPSEKVAMVSRNSIAYALALYGTLRAGACAVPLSAMAAAESIAMMLDDSDSKVLFVEAEYLPLVEAAMGRLTKIVPGGFIALDFVKEGWTRFEEFYAAGAVTAPARQIAPDWDFNIIYSSGTTGVPKGILHTRELRWRTVCGPLLAQLGFGAGGITLVSTPLYSNTTMAIVLPSLFWGSSIVLMRKSDTVRFLELAQQHRATHAMLVPVQYQRLLEHPDFDRYDLSAFKLKMSTSAPLRPHIKRQAIERWPGGLIEIYGLTEGGAATVLAAHEFPDKLHTVGKPAADADMRIVDENGNELPQGEVGEIIGRGPLMMKGYYKKPDKTEEFKYVSKDGLVFFRQGDMGKFDEDGFLILLDRKKDMIISGGFNIYASDLEVELLKHPAVNDVAVIGVPSHEWGESPYALVVRQPGRTETVEEIVAWANARLGKLQRLAGGELRDQLPRSSIGKILKRELRAPFWEQEGRAI